MVVRKGNSWTVSAVALVLALGMTSALTAQDFPVSTALPEEARQFDFWVGEWDVNLRVRQDDLSWADQIRAVARIYPILRGKAILELWSDVRASGIKGYSLRYYDTERDEWVLWLNWPGPDRSGSSSLSGSFRHGRGEFFATRRAADGSETLSRYTFSDITPESLRWDDAYSSDGGETWTHRWIMEFTRTGAKPTLPMDGGPAHTYHDGERCTAPEFRAYEFLAGRRSGSVEVGGGGEIVIIGYEILDGCAVMTLAGPSGDPERAFAFSHVTWNTYASRYELTTLTSAPDASARVFYTREGAYPRAGAPGAEATAGAPGALVFYESVDGDRPPDRFRIEAHDEGGVTWSHETPEGETWRPLWRATVRPEG